MEIRYLGHSSFQIKGKKVTLVTDPYDPSIGLKMPRVSADIVTVSHQHQDHNCVAAVGPTARREPFIIAGPGEYEASDVPIFGFASFHDDKKGHERGKSTIYVISLEEMRLVHLGDLGHQLNDKLVEEINGVDVLFVPVGGTYTLDPQQAAQVVGQIEPKIVIPMHYQTKGLIYKLAPVDEFLKEMGAEVKAQEKLTVSRDKLPEEREVVVLKKW